MSFDDIFACPKQGPDDGLWIRTIDEACKRIVEMPESVAEQAFRGCVGAMKDILRGASTEDSH